MGVMSCVLDFRQALAQSGNDAVQSGPMIGHVSMRSAQMWIQTNHEADVQVRYSAESEDLELLTPPVKTMESSAFTAMFICMDWSRAPIIQSTS